MCARRVRCESISRRSEQHAGPAIVASGAPAFLNGLDDVLDLRRVLVAIVEKHQATRVDEREQGGDLCSETTRIVVPVERDPPQAHGE